MRSRERSLGFVHRRRDGRLTSAEVATLKVGGTAVWNPLRAVSRTGATDLVRRLNKVNEGVPDGWPTGLEHDLLRRGRFVLGLPSPTVRNPRGAAIQFLDGASMSHLRKRPPLEIAARHIWERRDSGLLGVADLLDVAELLGGIAEIRTRPMRTTPFASGHILEYTTAKQVPARLARLLRRFNAPPANTDPLLHATGIYFETLLIHPLPDGNGRLARLLFQAALRQTIGLRAPIVPLGPACAMNRPLLIASYLKWEFDGDAQPLVDFITAALAALLDLYERNP